MTLSTSGETISCYFPFAVLEDQRGGEFGGCWLLGELTQHQSFELHGKCTGGLVRVGLAKIVLQKCKRFSCEKDGFHRIRFETPHFLEIPTHEDLPRVVEVFANFRLLFKRTPKASPPKENRRHLSAVGSPPLSLLSPEGWEMSQSFATGWCGILIGG